MRCRLCKFWSDAKWQTQLQTKENDYALSLATEKRSSEELKRKMIEEKTASDFAMQESEPTNLSAELARQMDVTAYASDLNQRTQLVLASLQSQYDNALRVNEKLVEECNENSDKAKRWAQECVRELASKSHAAKECTNLRAQRDTLQCVSKELKPANSKLRTDMDEASVLEKQKMDR